MIYASARLASIGARLFVSLFIAFGALLAASFMPTAIPSAGATVQLFECAQGAMPFPVSVDSGAKLGWIYDEPNPPTTDKRDDDSPTAHTGIDIRLKLGTPIYATGTGTIERRTDSATHVWYPDVVVSFPNGTTVKGIDVYIAHMTSVTNPGTVERGDVIGYSSGSNGLNHIHMSFGLSENYNDTHLEDTVDPTRYLGADVDWDRRLAEHPVPVDTNHQWIHATWSLAQWCGGPGMSGGSSKLPLLDLALVIDTTESMEPYINAVKSEAATIVNSIASKGVDYRLALIDYKDFGDAYVARTDVAFTTNQAAMVDAINDLSTYGGGDIPEAEYSALIYAMQSPSVGAWRNGAAKQIILMTDAYPHDPEPYTGYTLNSVTQAALALDPAIIQTIALGTEAPTQSYAESIAAGTGGQTFTATTENDVVDAVLKAIDVSTSSPSSSRLPLDSPHPYPNDFDQSWILTNPDTPATATKVHFPWYLVQKNQDFIMLYDSSNTLIQTLTGWGVNVWSDPVPGRIVKVRLVSSRWIKGYGFSIDQLQSYGTSTELTFFDDFSSDQPGQPPSGWSQRGTTDPSSTPSVIEVGGTGPGFRVVSFPYVSWQYWDKWLIKDGLTLSPNYTVTAKLNFQTGVADRAGITIGWKDVTLDRIDIQPNVAGDDIEFRASAGIGSSYTVSGSATTGGGLPINANTDYWLRVSTSIAANGDGVLVVSWSTDGVHFSEVERAVGPSLGGQTMVGQVGFGTAGPNMPNVWFDDFTVTEP